MKELLPLFQTNLVALDKKKHLKNIILNLVNHEKVENFKSEFVYFSHQGLSGAKIGYFKNNQNKIMKYTKFNSTNLISAEKHCLYLKHSINELFINLVLKYHKKFNTSEEYLIQKHIFQIQDYAVNKNEIILVTPRIGILHQKTYYTESNSIFLFNLQQILLEPSLLPEYEKFIIKNYIEPLDKTLRILYAKIKYINTDCKMKNIFVKAHKIKGFKNLKNKGIITDFIPLLSDFDKARIKLGGTDILSKSNLKSTIFSKTRYQPILDLRGKCDFKYGVTKCTKIKPGDYDLLSLIINIYLNFYKFKIADIPEIDTYIRKRFKLNQNEMKLFQEVIKSEVKRKLRPIKITRLTNISKIIYYFCGKLEP